MTGLGDVAEPGAHAVAVGLGEPVHARLVEIAGQQDAREADVDAQAHRVAVGVVGLGAEIGQAGPAGRSTVTGPSTLMS